MNTKTIVMAVIALAVIGIAAMQFNGNTGQDKAASTSTTMEASTSGDEAVQDSTLKDGTYEATGEYTSPGGEESLGVTITLQDGIIVNAEVEPQATREISKKMQASFQEGFKEFVVGKPITDIKLSKVSASSLTSGGFNDALQQIIKDAQG